MMPDEGAKETAQDLTAAVMAVLANYEDAELPKWLDDEIYDAIYEELVEA